MDNPGLIGKVASGNLQNLGAVDGIGAARTITGFMPGAAQFLDLPLAAVEGGMTSEQESEEYKKKIGRLSTAARQSYGVKRKLGELKDRWWNNMGEALASAVGGLLGGIVGVAALSFVLPPIGGIIGGIAGAFAGGYVTNKIYTNIFPDQHQEALVMASELCDTHAQGQTITPEATFAMMAANLPPKERRLIEDELKKRTGSRFFHEALETSEGTEALHELMINYDADMAIKTGLVNDPLAVGGKTVAERYADLINSGMVTPAQILTNDPMVALLAMQQDRPASVAMQPVAPVTPGMNRGYSKGPSA